MMARDEHGDEVFPDADYIPVSNTPPQQAEKTRTPAQWAVIAFAVVGLLVAGWFAWQGYQEHQDNKKTEQLAEQVESSMQDYLKTDNDLSKYTVRVLSVDLNKESDSKYEGVATVNTARSAEEHLVPIEVTLYGEKMMWQAEPGAFLFLMQEDLQNFG